MFTRVSDGLSQIEPNLKEKRGKLKSCFSHKNPCRIKQVERYTRLRHPRTYKKRICLTFRVFWTRSGFPIASTSWPAPALVWSEKSRWNLVSILHGPVWRDLPVSRPWSGFFSQMIRWTSRAEKWATIPSPNHWFPPSLQNVKIRLFSIRLATLTEEQWENTASYSLQNVRGECIGAHFTLARYWAHSTVPINHFWNKQLR